ncbi:MAG TPA: nucleotidyltransferase family protein [Candidatus Hydrogenedentes bacterium]|nr:nucleotidyltransferase family protein [Candidatus Hydrogenedentota bacterium]
MRNSTTNETDRQTRRRRASKLTAFPGDGTIAFRSANNALHYARGCLAIHAARPIDRPDPHGADGGVVTSVILCGGLGMRLQSVLGSIPKALANVAGRPFLDHLLTRLHGQGIRDVVLCTGVGADHIQAHCRNGQPWGLAIRYSREESPLDTAGALKRAAPLIASNPFLVMNGDSMVRVDLAALLAAHIRTGAHITLVAVNVSDRARYGSLRLEADDQIAGFEEKGVATGPGPVSAGTYVINRDVLETIPADKAVSLERDVFPRYARRGLFGFQTPGPLLDIGTPASYRTAPDILAKIMEETAS